MAEVKELIMKKIEEIALYIKQSLDEFEDGNFDGDPLMQLHMLADFQAELEKYRWIPVSERLPKVFKDVYCYRSRAVLITTESLFCVLGWYNSSDRCLENVEGTIDLVTHWMPIPILPKEGKDNS